MKLPISLARLIRRHLIAESKPLCLLIDRQHRLIHMWGSHQHYKLELTPQDFAESSLPFLVGLPFDEVTELPFVQLPSGKMAHLNMLPYPPHLAILITDPTLSHTQRQSIQQKSMEIRLLQEEQAKLHNQLQDAYHLLEKANQLKSQFIAGMSHEYRTPLAAVLGHVTLLQKTQPESERSSYSLNAIRRSAQHLLSLIENILDFSVIERGSLMIQRGPVCIDSLLTDLDLIFQPQCKSKQLEFKLERPPSIPATISGDETRLRQILINLLGNAVKFSHRGKVLLDVSWEDSKLTIRVSDNGPGIDPQLRKELFTPFSRGNQKAKGTGLGLAISSELASLMGGQLSLEQTSSMGSTFKLDIPAPLWVQDPEVYAEVPATGEGSRILIFEDNPDIVDLIEILFSEITATIHVSDNSRNALELLNDIDPHLVLTDMYLSRGTGYEVIETLRSAGYGRPILFMTASSDDEIWRKAQALGASENLIKPFHIPTFLARMSSLLNKPVG